jgi:hypothetical protein
LLQAYLYLPKLKFYIERQVGNYYLRDGREGNFNFFYNIVNKNTPNYLCTLSKFKSELKNIDETENHSVPKHFFCGSRKLNIILTQLRNSASFLNFDLFRVGIVSDPFCRCGAALENFHCYNKEVHKRHALQYVALITNQ